ncbi:hypothetical protein MCAMS1_01065 [biofilm metagenome]
MKGGIYAHADTDVGWLAGKYYKNNMRHLFVTEKNQGFLAQL